MLLRVAKMVAAYPEKLEYDDANIVSDDDSI
jgi:hypothetical protein